MEITPTERTLIRFYTGDLDRYSTELIWDILEPAQESLIAKGILIRNRFGLLELNEEYYYRQINQVQ